MGIPKKNSFPNPSTRIFAVYMTPPPKSNRAKKSTPFIHTRTKGGGLTIGRVNPEVNGHGGDALVAARHAVRLGLDLQPHLVEVGELLALGVQELGVLAVLRVEQLEDERPPGHDAGAARQKVAAHKVLQHTRLARALAAHHRDLRQVDRDRRAQRRERVLQLIYDRDQPLHTRIAHCRHFASFPLLSSSSSSFSSVPSGSISKLALLLQDFVVILVIVIKKKNEIVFLITKKIYSRK